MMNDYICINGRKMLIIKRDWSDYDGKNTPRTEECPFCGGRHLHGGNDGHRIAHCGTNVPNQTITSQDGSLLDVNNGYWIMDINKP